MRSRMAEVGLELHRDKTRIVYCKDDDRRGEFDHIEFTFLGFTFRPRAAQDRHGRRFTSFLPAVSAQALKRMSKTVHDWRLHRRTDLAYTDLNHMINPVVRGWMAYYGRFYHSALSPLLYRVNTYLMRWIMKKYQVTSKAAQRKLTLSHTIGPRYFAHWIWASPAKTPIRAIRAV